jgi:hypothetical protein
MAAAHQTRGQVDWNDGSNCNSNQKHSCFRGNVTLLFTFIDPHQLSKKYLLCVFSIAFHPIFSIVYLIK